MGEPRRYDQSGPEQQAQQREKSIGSWLYYWCCRDLEPHQQDLHPRKHSRRPHHRDAFHAANHAFGRSRSGRQKSTPRRPHSQFPNNLTSDSTWQEEETMRYSQAHPGQAADAQYQNPLPPLPTVIHSPSAGLVPQQVQPLYMPKSQVGGHFGQNPLRQSMASTGTYSMDRQETFVQGTGESSVRNKTPMGAELDGNGVTFFEDDLTIDEDVGEIDKILKEIELSEVPDKLLLDKLSTSVLKVLDAYSAIGKHLEAQRQVFQSQIQRLEWEGRQSQRTMDTLQATLAQRDEIIHAFEDAKQKETQDLVQKRLEEQRTQLEASHADKMNRLQNLYTQEQEKSRDLGSQLAEMKIIILERDTALKTSARTQAELRTQMSELEKRHRAEILAKENSEMQKLRRKEEEMSTQRQNFLDEKEKLKQEYEDLLSNKETAHSKQIKSLEADHFAKARSLRAELLAFKSASLSREVFKSMSDDEFGKRFLEVSSEVEELSQLDWDNQRQSNWPVSSVIISSADHDRIAKQQALQHNLWVILYQSVFCSPFRVLGEEGLLFEEDWYKSYGSGDSSGTLPYPKATTKCENSRHITIQQFNDSINGAAKSATDSKRKASFQNAQAATVKALLQELERVAAVNSSYSRRTERMVEKLAMFWLNVGIQRCRFYVVMTTAKIEPVAVAIAEPRNRFRSELVVSPELRRVGDGQGAQLEKDELVKGRSGKYAYL